MSDYVKSTDFAVKDGLVTGNPLKIISGTEINTEFNNIQTAVATKADLASPAFTGNPTAPTQAAGNNTTRIATTAFVQTAISNQVETLYPVGSIYINATNATNPGTLLGFGTWVAFGTGRVMVGIDTANTLMDTAEETFGQADTVLVSHSHLVTDPGHGHSYTSPIVGAGNNQGGGAATAVRDPNLNGAPTVSSTTGISLSTEGVAATNKNYQPSIVVYMWKRTV